MCVYVLHTFCIYFNEPVMCNCAVLCCAVLHTCAYKYRAYDECVWKCRQQKITLSAWSDNKIYCINNNVIQTKMEYFIWTQRQCISNAYRTHKHYMGYISEQTTNERTNEQKKERMKEWMFSVTWKESIGKVRFISPGNRYSISALRFDRFRTFPSGNWLPSTPYCICCTYEYVCKAALIHRNFVANQQDEPRARESESEREGAERVSTKFISIVYIYNI